MNREYILGQEKEFNALMKLSIPAIIAMFVNAIYNIVDTMFIGRSVGALGIAGVSIYLPIQMIIMSVSLLIGVGTASIISRSLGNGDIEKTNKASGNLFLIIGIFSVFTATFGFIFAKDIVKIFGASNEVLPFATHYAKTMFLGVLVFPMCVSANNIIRAEGNAKDAMNCMIIGMIVNIFLDYLFICIFDMGIAGAGLATSISKFINFSYLVYYFTKKTSIKVKLSYLKLDMDIFKCAISIGMSAFILQISSSIVTLLLNYLLYNYGGNDAVSVYGIVYKLTLFIQMPLSGLIQGMQPLVGYNRGCNNEVRVKNVVKINLIVSTVIATLLTLVVFINPNMFIKLFTSDTNLIYQGSNVLKISILIYPILGVYMTAVGFFQSIGKGKEALMLSLLRQIVLFIPLVLILPSVFNMGILGIWVAFPLSDLLSCLLTLMFVKYNSMKNKPNVTTT